MLTPVFDYEVVHYSQSAFSMHKLETDRSRSILVCYARGTGAPVSGGGLARDDQVVAPTSGTDWQPTSRMPAWGDLSRIQPLTATLSVRPFGTRCDRLVHILASV